jgi:Tfp pilus assembly PilM family ATPase|tara:strand:+ start:879 stop:1046 length:168 start_codon:yes stop_codon:yes gene_type:complete
MKEIKTELPRIKLIRGQRGSYGWEISVPDEDLNSAIIKVKSIDEKLQKKFTRSEQ